MLRTFAIALLIASPAFAQDATDHSTMDHAALMSGGNTHTLTQPGQSAFAAIEEVVLALDANPMTDWSKVDISGLREHLRDMDLVFTAAEVTTEPVASGLRFVVIGEGRVRDAIQNMTLAHAGVMNEIDTWEYSTEVRDNGAAMTVTAPPFDLDRLRALGFFGIMASGMHHQDHHWAMATGGDPHM